jgi:hypothetical protein
MLFIHKFQHCISKFINNILAHCDSKKTVLFFLPLLSITTITCTSPVEKDLLNYVNIQMKNVAEMESKPIDLYNSIISDKEMDNETSAALINDSVLPAYKEYILKLESISSQIKTPAVKQIHEICISAANAQFYGISLAATALLKNDNVMMVKSGEKTDEGRKLMRQYNDALSRLGKKYKLQLQDIHSEEQAPVESKQPSSQSNENSGDEAAKKVEFLYANCISTHDEPICTELIKTLSVLPDWKFKGHLEKLCNKYAVKQACDKLK